MADKDLALMIAVAMGTPRAIAQAALDAEFPDQAAPVAGDVIGGGRENGQDFEIVIAPDGVSTERRAKI